MRAWFQTWNRAPPNPRAATTGSPFALAVTPSPMPNTTRPTFSTLE